MVRELFEGTRLDFVDPVQHLDVRKDQNADGSWLRCRVTIGGRITSAKGMSSAGVAAGTAPRAASSATGSGRASLPPAPPTTPT